MEKLKAVLAKIAEKTNNIAALQYIQKALAMMLPVTLVGSLFSLLTGLPFTPWTNFINSTGLVNAFNLVYNSTYGYMSLILSFCMAYQYAVSNKQRKNALACGIMSVCCFLISCGDNSASYIGTMGMLGAFIVGGLVGWIFKKLIEANITIKLPEGVPPMVSQSFVALLPSLTVCLVFMVINFALSFTSFGTLQDIIYALVRVPLTAVGANAFGEFVLVVYCTMLWFFGIHGGMIMMPIIMVIFMEKTMGNLAAYTAGQPLPNMFVGTVLLGEGFAVNLAILFASHRKELKEIAKIGIVPYLFNISEPTNFGVPIIMNPNFFIPYLLTPIIGWVLTHGAQLIGFLGYNNGTSVAWTLPTSVQAFFYYGWQGAVVNLLVTFVTFLLYIPFVKMNDAALDKADAEAVKE